MVGIYMDVQVPVSITRGLRQRGVSVRTAQEDGGDRWPDEQILARAGELGCLLFTMDTDFLAVAVHRQRFARTFATVIFARPYEITIGCCIDDLAIIADAVGESEHCGQIIYLPL